MSVKNLERVMWRLRNKIGKDELVATNHTLRRCIMFECGTDPATYKSNRKALVDLGWVKSKGKKRVLLTNNDLTGEE